MRSARGSSWQPASLFPNAASILIESLFSVCSVHSWSCVNPYPPRVFCPLLNLKLESKHVTPEFWNRYVSIRFLWRSLRIRKGLVDGVTLYFDKSIGSIGEPRGPHAIGTGKNC